jgi:hypothetical protein
MVAAVAASLIASNAWAEPTEPQLPTIEWAAPPGCPGTDQIRKEVLSLLSGSERTSRQKLVARATVTEKAGRFSARIELEAPTATESKAIEGETCAAVADAFAVVIAFAIDPSAASLGSSAAKPMDSRPSAAANPTTAEPPPSLAISHLDWAVGPMIASGVGIVPSPAFAAGARLSVGHAPRWELAGLYWPGREASIGLVSGDRGTGDVQLLSVEPSVCLPLGRGIGATCLGATVGEMRAAGGGVLNPGAGRSWWLAAELGMGARVPVAAWLRLRLQVGVGVPVFRPSFVLENVDPAGPVQVYRPAPMFALIEFQPEMGSFSSTDSGELGHTHP